ncbi:hypothetical protein Nepgr_022943 [Nepenthes gracilis]|uniref:Uncharacterized protein n=1 Tax=Nepenthes gracilis TaxID=150966 RepID=A0AAD3T1V9_NEPGR|nr:hypothetical protein Nepgr_022943 [Nepenthes gracilis]
MTRRQDKCSAPGRTARQHSNRGERQRQIFNLITFSAEISLTGWFASAVSLVFGIPPAILLIAKFHRLYVEQVSWIAEAWWFFYAASFTTESVFRPVRLLPCWDWLGLSATTVAAWVVKLANLISNDEVWTVLPMVSSTECSEIWWLKTNCCS